MNNKEKLVIKYEEITKNLITSLKNDDLDLFYDLVIQREEIIFELKRMPNLSFSEDFKKEIKLVDLERILKQLIEDKLRQYKYSMNDLSKNIEAHNAYTDYFKKMVSFNTKA